MRSWVTLGWGILTSRSWTRRMPPLVSFSVCCFLKCDKNPRPVFPTGVTNPESTAHQCQTLLRCLIWVKLRTVLTKRVWIIKEACAKMEDRFVIRSRHLIVTVWTVLDHERSWVAWNTSQNSIWALVGFTSRYWIQLREWTQSNLGSVH